MGWVRASIAGPARAFCAGSLALALAGCASPTPPRAELARARLAVDEAAEAEASQHAPEAYAQAQDRLRAAERASADEDFEQARRLAEHAEVSAELAEARSRAEQAEAQLQALRETVDGLLYRRSTDPHTPFEGEVR